MGIGIIEKGKSIVYKTTLVNTLSTDLVKDRRVVLC